MASECTQVTQSNLGQFLSKFDTVLFDCDGVMWHSSTVIPRAQETISLLKELGKRVFYITNNSSKTRAEYAKKLETLGFQAVEDEIVCTAHVAAVYLKNKGFDDKVFLIGPRAMEEELEANGIRWTKHQSEASDPHAALTFSAMGESMRLDPDVRCVMVGADLHFTYEKMCRACLYLYRKEEECLFVGTNCDPQFPLADGRAVPGTGSIIAAVGVASGREPTFIGKPDPPMFDFLHDKYHIDASRTLMVGDRLETDIKLAKNNDMSSLLVLTGVHKLDDVTKLQQSGNPDERNLVPDFYIESVTKWAEYMERL